MSKEGSPTIIERELGEASLAVMKRWQEKDGSLTSLISDFAGCAYDDSQEYAEKLDLAIDQVSGIKVELKAEEYEQGYFADTLISEVTFAEEDMIRIKYIIPSDD